MFRADNGHPESHLCYDTVCSCSIPYIDDAYAMDVKDAARQLVDDDAQLNDLVSCGPSHASTCSSERRRRIEAEEKAAAAVVAAHYATIERLKAEEVGAQALAELERVRVTKACKMKSNPIDLRPAARPGTPPGAGRVVTMARRLLS